MDNHKKESKDNKNLVLDITVQENSCEYASNIESALFSAELEKKIIEKEIHDNAETVKNLTPDSDLTDYALAASCGVLCGIMDIFLVGDPKFSPLGIASDKWIEDRVKDFAKLNGWKGKKASSAIHFIEKKFKIPYDQTTVGGAAKEVFNLTTSNHHFKSLAHNPTIVGLFFSILDQFTNSSHFVSGGDLLALVDASDTFVLRGSTVPSKIFCGITNWVGHLISDISGSSGSKGRGMGIPSPLWTWMNDIIAIKRGLRIPASEFDKSFNELAMNIFEEGYDIRFQIAQSIPVIINELVVRTFYSTRRMIRYFSDNPRGERSFKDLWNACEPFSNVTVKRMLTVAHGSFCMLDVGDATVRAVVEGGFNVPVFVMRINVIGIGRFAISLFGETTRGMEIAKAQHEVDYLLRERVIVDDYLDGLRHLAEVYDDKALVTFVSDFTDSSVYKERFLKSAVLAEKRGVSGDGILRNKTDIDAYFLGGSNNEK